MSNGVYRKTNADLVNTTKSSGGQQKETNRLTAVIQGGTIQVGYTPVAATLSAEITEQAQTVTPREDKETTPGFTLAQASKPEQSAATQPAPQVEEPVVIPEADRSDIATNPAKAVIAPAHPVIPLGFMFLFSLFVQALFWGTPLFETIRLVQLPIPLLISSFFMAAFAYWLSKSNDYWGPTPWYLAAFITLHSISMPLINGWLGGPGLGDVALYMEYGEKLLNTGLIPINPAPEYPPLAVWTFGGIAFLNESLMIPPSIATALIMAVPGFVMWLMLGRTNHGWLVAMIALLPWSAMWLAIRFDALPTALLVFALWLVRPDEKEQTGKVILSAFIFGLAAAAKWYPGLGAIILFFGYLAVRKYANAFIMFAGSVVGFALPHFPWVLHPLGRQAIIDAYLFHAERGVTGESLIWQFLYPLKLAGMPRYAWADAPFVEAGPWPTVLVGVALAIPVLMAAWKPQMAWVSAAMAPAMWLMANRIFSVQFVLTITVIWLLVLTLYAKVKPFWRLVLLVGLAVMNVNNWMIWPIMDRGWPGFSAVTFMVLVPTTIILWIVCARKEAALHEAGNHSLTISRKPTAVQEPEPSVTPV